MTIWHHQKRWVFFSNPDPFRALLFLPIHPTPQKGRKIPNCKSPPEVTPRLYLNEDLISKLNKRLSVYNLESDCELEAASFLTVWQRDNGLDWLGGRAGEWSWVEKTRKCFFVSDPLRVELSVTYTTDKGRKWLFRVNWDHAGGTRPSKSLPEALYLFLKNVSKLVDFALNCKPHF